MKKVMLITGASRGIGKACYEYFKKTYEVISVSRTAGDIVGDLTDKNFRNKLVSIVQPDVFINNAGVGGAQAIDQMLEINFIAAAELALEFSKKMTSGSIINILSTGSKVTYKGMSDSELLYYTSKGALEVFLQSLQGRQTDKIKITNLELGYVMTDMADIRKKFSEQIGVFEKCSIVPMDTSYVASTIDWILSQPTEVVISHLKIKNNYDLKPAFKKLINP